MSTDQDLSLISVYLWLYLKHFSSESKSTKSRERNETQFNDEPEGDGGSAA